MNDAPLSSTGRDNDSPDRQLPDVNGRPGRAHSPASVLPCSKPPLPVLAAALKTRRTWFLALAHAVIFTLIYWFAFLLRFDLAIPRDYQTALLLSLPGVLGIKLAAFHFSGQFHGWWRYVSFGDLVALVRASVFSSLLIVTASYFGSSSQIPRSVLILDFLLTVVVLGAMRCTVRVGREHFWPAVKPEDFNWALLVGTDHDSVLLANQIHSQTQLPYRIKGFLATRFGEEGRWLGQIPVLGHVSRLGSIAAAHQTTDVLVTAGVLPGAELRQLMAACRESNLHLKIIPALEDRLNGGQRLPIRDIDINDLLRREPIQLDSHAIAELIEGRVVMVTGAGGSIGSEICRQVLRFSPRVLVLLGRGENRIFFVERELRAIRPDTKIVPRIGDVTDGRRMRQVFEEFRPEVVFHAAAHKHVPLMEANVGEAVKNNILGTRCVADLARTFKAGAFVLISTDKAVHPTSVMGVTKHIAERYVHSLSQDSSTRFMVTRFGNVLGSAGSVVPIFKEQIQAGGPITITDPRMTRFFMTIPEASQLVLQAAAMGKGGEIFVLDMGEPVRIVDLARDLIRLAGLPEDAIDIVYSGVRPGEKLYEELYFDDEETLPTPHPKLRAAYHRPHSADEVVHALDELKALVHANPEALRNKLAELVPEYQFRPGSPEDAGTTGCPAGRLAMANEG